MPRVIQSALASKRHTLWPKRCAHSVKQDCRRIRNRGGGLSAAALLTFRIYKRDKDQNVTVKAFLVNHGDVPQSFGHRLETPDRTIVISGDVF